MTEMELITLKNIEKSFDKKERILKSINLTIKNREFITLLGPSGCGKTTMLRILGGFESADAGDIFFEGQRINDLPPYKRNINTVFQRYALFPHLNVYDNIAFGLNIKKMDRKEIKRKVFDMLELVNLVGFENRSVTSLSGGQQQRIAIARALVNQPKVLLLDEPLGALDLKLRKEMQIELKKIHNQLDITFIYVTHDQEEALTMSDTVVVMNKGNLLQIGTPVDIYNEPINAFVADFIGESNILDGVMIKDYCVEFANMRWTCLDKGFSPNENIDVVIRPEDLDPVSANEGMIKGVVESVVFKGVHYEMIINVNNHRWMVHSTQLRQIGEVVGLSLDPDDIHIMKKSGGDKDEV